MLKGKFDYSWFEDVVFALELGAITILNDIRNNDSQTPHYASTLEIMQPTSFKRFYIRSVMRRH